MTAVIYRYGKLVSDRMLVPVDGGLPYEGNKVFDIGELGAVADGEPVLAMGIAGRFYPFWQEVNVLDILTPYLGDGEFLSGMKRIVQECPETDLLEVIVVCPNTVKIYRYEDGGWITRGSWNRHDGTIVGIGTGWDAAIVSWKWWYRLIGIRWLFRVISTLDDGTGARTNIIKLGGLKV